MRKITFDLSEEQLKELDYTLKHHRLAYMRERASGILQVYRGSTAKEVGRSGLLQVRQGRSVRRWINVYQSEGLSGLVNKKGRGRKPCFFPLNQ